QKIASASASDSTLAVFIANSSGVTARQSSPAKEECVRNIPKQTVRVRRKTERGKSFIFNTFREVLFRKRRGDINIRRCAYRAQRNHADSSSARPKVAMIFASSYRLAVSQITGKAIEAQPEAVL